jgi:hypothetical protein
MSILRPPHWLVDSIRFTQSSSVSLASRDSLLNPNPRVGTAILAGGAVIRARRHEPGRCGVQSWRRGRRIRARAGRRVGLCVEHVHDVPAEFIKVRGCPRGPSAFFIMLIEFGLWPAFNLVWGEEAIRWTVSHVICCFDSNACVPAIWIQLAAPMGTLGRAAAEMQMKKGP